MTRKHHILTNYYISGTNSIELEMWTSKEEKVRLIAKHQSKEQLNKYPNHHFFKVESIGYMRLGVGNKHPKLLPFFKVESIGYLLMPLDLQ